MKTLNTNQDFYSAVGNNDFTVVFEKTSDDELRILEGTCDKKKIANLLPPKKGAKNKSKVKRKNNPQVVSVFDLEANEWRAFRLDSLLKVDIKAN
jgi:hypothetical protein